MKQMYKKKTQNVYETVNSIDHKLITLRLVHNEKYVSSKLNVKTRRCSRYIIRLTNLQ